MGRFFSNIHIKKNNEINLKIIEQKIIKFMISNGYQIEQNKENSDEMISLYSSKDTKWITIFSNFIDLNKENDLKNIATSLNIETDILGIKCYDSDYLSINLVNIKDNINAWLNIGNNNEFQTIRKNNFNLWKNKVRDIDKLKKASQETFIFSEDFLKYTNEFFELPIEQATLEQGIKLELKEKEEFKELYFSINKNNDIQQELPKLELYLPSLIPCIPGESEVISVLNKGGDSRGLAIAIFGEFVEKDEITFSETYLQYKNKDKFELIPIKFEKKQNSNGLWGYEWRDENFYIPPKINNKLSLNKQLNLEFERSFGIRFTPTGNNRKFLDIKVCFIPLKNWKDGQCTWYVWRNYKNKKTFLESENMDRKKFTNEIFPKDRLGLYNLDDYDLD